MKDKNTKKIDWTFDFKKIPKHDREYLRSMAYETIENKSYKNSGKPFAKYYPNADNFTLFSDESTMEVYMNEFAVPYAYTMSHLLDGKKYYFAWTYFQKNIRNNEKNIIY